MQSEAEIRIWAPRNRQRPAALVHQVLRHAARSPLAGVVEDIYEWYSQNEKYLRNENAAGASGPGLLAADGPVLRRPAGSGEGRGPSAGMVPGADRGRAFPSRWCTTGCSMPGISTVQDADPAEYRGAFAMRSAEQIREFVERGGSLVATYETSLYDEWGVARKDFGLADLFGVSFRGMSKGRCRTPIFAWRRRARGNAIPFWRDSKTRRASFTASPAWNHAPLGFRTRP